MFLRRNHLRTPALFGALFLLLSGAADAFGVDACARHMDGHAHGSTVEAGAASDGSAHDAHAGHGSAAAATAAADSHAHVGSAHTGHAPAPESTTHAGHSADEHAAHLAAEVAASHESDESGCDCRFLCLAGATVSVPAPVVFAFTAAPIPPTPAETISTELIGVVAQSLLPYVLPFSNAPPTHV